MRRSQIKTMILTSVTLALLPSNAAFADKLDVIGFRELPRAAVEYLAAKFEGFEVTVAKNSPLAELIFSQCGLGTTNEARLVLETTFTGLNPQLKPVISSGRMIEAGTKVKIPFCARIDIDQIHLLAGENLQSELESVYPIIDNVFMEKTKELTYLHFRESSCKGMSADDCFALVKPNSVIKVPYMSRITGGKLKQGVSAREAVRALQAAAPQHKKLIETTAVKVDKPQVVFVGDVTLDQLDSNDQCGPPTADAAPWPFDQSLVLRQMTETADAIVAQSGGKLLSQSHIAIIDSGVSEKVFKSVFQPLELVFRNPGEWKYGPNKEDDDRNGIVDEFHGIGNGKGAGTNGALEPNFFSFLDAGDSQVSHGTKVATAVFGGSEMLQQLGRDKRRPFVVSFLRISKRFGEKNVGPEYRFLPEAIEWALKKDARVVNISLSHVTPRMAYETLLEKAVVVAAAGNNSRELNSSANGPFPASWGGMSRLPYITVGAHDRQFNRLSKSNHGQASNHGMPVDLFAPGCAISVHDEDGKQSQAIGTSFAAPFVSFTAGILSNFGLSDPRAIRNRIIASTDFRKDLDGLAWSSGTLNIAKAISIMDDVIDIRGHPKGPVVETLYGRLDLDEGLVLADFCNLTSDDQLEALQDAKIAGLATFTDGAGNLRLRYMYFPNAVHEIKLHKIECGLKAWVAATKKIGFVPKGGGARRVFTIAELVGVVPRPDF